MEETTACWSCAGAIDAADRYCRRCGMGQGERLAWYYRPLWIAVLTAFALGPLALPLVWRTPRLGLKGKLAGTALVLGFTAWVCWKLYRIYQAVRLLLTGYAGY